MEAGLIATAGDYSSEDGDNGHKAPPVFRFPLIEVGRSLKAKTSPEEKSKTGRIGPVLLFALIACIGGILGGYSHGFPSPALLELETAYQGGERVTAFSSSSIFEGLFGAIGPIGGLFGGSISGPVSDRLGRSAALVLMSIPHLIGWLAQAYARLMPTFDSFVAVLMLGRWFTGFGTGWGSLVITVAKKEMTPSETLGQRKVYQSAVQHYGSWWTLTFITSLSIPFVVIFIPETRGKSLERIEESFKSKQESETEITAV